ncbi:MAG: putative D-alanyl-D-alanine carboxypeptidase [Actinomycetota bacterium]
MARRRNPYPALVVAALVPALALGGCWNFASGRAPEGVTLAPVTSTQPAVVPPALSTPLLSFRRAPAVLSQSVNLGTFVAAGQQFAGTVDSTSCVEIALDGVPVASANADVPLIPASNVKLVVASVALEVLGADFRYHTGVRGSLAGGVVDGNLYMVGSGDPLLSSSWWRGSSELYPKFNVTSIERLADAIVSAGVTSITGSVVGDSSRYDGEWYPPTWSQDIRFTEGGPISALLVNDDRETPTVSSDDPTIGAATVLTTLLAERGVTIGGAPSAGVAPEGSAEIAFVESKPMTAVLAEMLTTSDNNTAEMVVKELGVARGGAGTREAGLSVVVETLTARGIDMTNAVLVDGSGLSSENRLTCSILMDVLQDHDPSDPVGAGLAVAGASGGTLYDAFADTELSGLLRAKTGTLYNYADGTGGLPAVKGLSGYVPVDGGGIVQFSLLLNGPDIAEKERYRPVWAALGAVLAGYPAGASPAELGPR